MAEKKKDEKKRISMSNTKKEMLQAYNELLKEKEEAEAGRVIPEEKAEEKKAQKVIETASSLTTEGVVQGISNLKLEVGKLLTQLSDKLEEEVKRFENVQEAITAKEKELQEIYEISHSAQTLSALIEAQNRKKTEFEEEMAAEKNELDKEIEKTREEWQAEEEKHKEKLAEQEKEEKKRREREKEDYLYDFNRQKKIEDDKLKDEKDKKIKVFQEEIETKKRELDEREQLVAEKEEVLNQLQARVDNFPKELETAVNKAVKETEERLQKEYKNMELLLQRDFAGEKNVLLAKTESMEQTIKQQQQEIEKLSRQLDSAYNRIEDIAVKTVVKEQNWKTGYQQDDTKKEPQK
jgi:hypothetical protein